MPCYEQRLQPLPTTFICLEEPSSCPGTAQRRSHSYSGYTPFALAEMEFKSTTPKPPTADDCESSTGAQSTADSSYALSDLGSERAALASDLSMPAAQVELWPDTDNEAPFGTPHSCQDLEPQWPDTDPEPVQWEPCAKVNAYSPAHHGACQPPWQQRAQHVELRFPSGPMPAVPPSAPMLSTPTPAPTWRPQLPLEALVAPPPHRPTFLFLPPSTPSAHSLAAPPPTGRSSASLGQGPVGAGPQFFQEPDSELAMADDEGQQSARRMASHRSQGNDHTPEEVTTMMIRNLSKSLSQQELLEDINRRGFSGLYDFCYLPRDFKTNESQGFAFVNFTSATTARQFMEAWNQQLRFASPTGGPQKVVVSKADLQGLEANLKRWAGPRMRRIRNPCLRPFVLSASIDAGTDASTASPVSQAALTPKMLKLTEHLTQASATQSRPAGPVLTDAMPAGLVAPSAAIQAKETGLLALRRARAMMPAVHMRARASTGDVSSTTADSPALGAHSPQAAPMPRLLGASVHAASKGLRSGPMSLREGSFQKDSPAARTDHGWEGLAQHAHT